MLCVSCCLIFPLPETLLYDLPDSLTDLQSMKRSISSETGSSNMSPLSQPRHVIDSNTVTLSREPRPTTAISSNLNDLSSPPQHQVSTPKTILRSQQPVATGGGGKTVTIHTQPEIIQLQPNPSLNALSNPCYFASVNDTLDQYDIEQHRDNRVVISIRGAQNGSNNNNNNNSEGYEVEATKF
jgi:hypothetical protein